MQVGFWNVSDEEFNEILRNKNIKPEDFNASGFNKFIMLSLSDRSLPGGDPWRLGRDFHINRALALLEKLDIAASDGLARAEINKENFKAQLFEWTNKNLEEYLREEHFVSLDAFNYQVFEQYIDNYINNDFPYLVNGQYISISTFQFYKLSGGDDNAFSIYPSYKFIVNAVVKDMRLKGELKQTHTPSSERERESIMFTKNVMCCEEEEFRNALEHNSILFSKFNITDFNWYYSRQDSQLSSNVRIDSAIKSMIRDGVVTIEQAEQKRRMEEAERERKAELYDKFSRAWANVLDVDVDNGFELGMALKGLETPDARRAMAIKLGYTNYTEDENGLPIFGDRTDSDV